MELITRFLHSDLARSRSEPMRKKPKNAGDLIKRSRQAIHDMEQLIEERGRLAASMAQSAEFPNDLKLGKYGRQKSDPRYGLAK